MSLSKLTYTKDWNNPSDFPTFETRESKVRADIQLLYDEMKDAFNKLIDDLKAAEVPFEATAAIQSTTVQAAIENVQEQVAGLVLDQLVLPERSIPGDRLELKAVGTTELDDAAVSTDQIADNAVTGAKIALGDDGITGANIKDHSIGDDQLAPTVMSWKADLDGNIVTRSQLRFRRIVPSVAGYTLGASDAWSFIQCPTPTPGSAQDVTFQVPVDSSIPVGSITWIVNGSVTTGSVSITAGSGLSFFMLGGTNGLSTSSYTMALGETVLLMKITDTLWCLVGQRVKNAMLDDEVVTTDKIGDNQVTGAKIGIGNDGVDTANIKDEAVTYEKTSGIQQKHTTLQVTVPVLSTGGSQQVNAPGVTATNTVFVTPDPADFIEWRDCGVCCVAQSDGKLTFMAETGTTNALTANVAIFNP